MRAAGAMLLLAGCYHPGAPAEAPCATNGDCPGMLTCDYGRSPPTCVDHTSGIPGGDAAIDPIDAAPDAPPDAPAPPAFAAEAHANLANVGDLSYPLTVPPGPLRFLIVSVQIGSNCDGAGVADVNKVTFAGTPLTRITSITGTPCDMTGTRSEQWQLVGPPLGGANVVVTLSNTAVTVHSGAVVITGIDPTTPVRASAIARGHGVASEILVGSMPGDFVVDTVGQGTSIDAPGQTKVFVNNASTHDTLDNSGASYTTATDTKTSMTWTFGGDDEWQTIATSLQGVQ